MDTQQQMEERLWNYIDGSISAEESAVIAQLLATDAAWKAKYSELLEVNQLLLSTDLESPSLRFTKNVMEEISKLHIAPATKTYINQKIVWGIGFFFISLIVALLIYGIGQTDWTMGKDTTIADKLSKIDIGQFFNNTWINAFMMVNVVLGLFLFDNFLSTKRKKFRKEA